MELLLNTIWLLLSGFAIAAWYRVSKSGGTRALSSALALACAILLLFPVISLTDDLHATQFALEDSSSSKRILKGVPATSSLFAAGFGPPAVLLCPTQNAVLHILGSVLPESSISVASSTPTPVQGRGPPLA